MAGFRGAPSFSCLLLLLTGVCVSTGPEGDRGVYQLPLQMPSSGTNPPKYNDYRCRATKLPITDKYIVSYEPRADPNVAHHMLLYGCRILGQDLGDAYTWNCKSNTICGMFSHPKILYAWALNASGFQLPPDVGQKVGPGNSINYLVVQIHYGPGAASIPASPSDPLALVLHMTSRSQQRLSGVYLIGSSSKIESGRKEVIIDTVCRFPGPKSIIPIAFRTHAHARSTLIVGYVGDGKDKWTEIGFRSPQDPQAFYPVENSSVSVNPGDWVAARCVYNTSDSAVDIHMGPDTEDEMCNFYIMYHTENDGHPLTRDNCWDEESTSSGIHFPPLPVLPPSQLSHSHSHHHSPMGGGGGPDDDEIEIIVPNPITSSDTETTSSRGKNNNEEEEDNYVCLTPIPPGPVPAHCTNTTPTNQEPTAGSSKEEYSIVLDASWPFNGINDPHVDAETGRGGALGQVTSVAMAPDGNVFVLHRGPRVWDLSTFTMNNLFVDAAKGPISTPVLLKFSGDGVLRGVWGGGLFYLPHSLTIDHNGGIWITDVAMHQVFKYNDLSAHTPSLSLGHPLIPGSRPGYFCKPADVAVTSSGDFYVADGYCNSRVVAYNSDGTLKAILGDFPIEGKLLLVPHSLTLSPSEDKLYVADRENRRIIVVDIAGAGKVKAFPVVGLDRVFALGLSGLTPGGWPMLAVVQSAGGERGYGLTITENDGVDGVWGAEEVFRKVHDIAVDPVNKAVYVAELSPARIWKYSIVTGDTTTASAPTTTTTEMTTETTHSTTHQPPSTTQGPHSTTHQPPSTTHQPPSTTHQPPSATHQPPSTTHQPPSSTTHQPPSSATHQPPSTTHQPPSTTHQPPSATQGPQETTTTDQTTTTLTTTQPNTQPTATETTPETHNTESTDNSTPTSVDISSGSHSDHSTTASSESPAYSGDTGGDNAEMTDDNGSLSEAQSSKAAPKKDKMATPAFHYGLFAAIFAIVGLILVVVVGILKEHRFLRFRTRRLVTETPAEGKTSREALHSLLGPSKLGFSRLRTYDSDSEAEEFPIFSRQL